MKIYKDIELYEISFVEHPANPECRVIGIDFREKNE